MTETSQTLHLSMNETTDMLFNSMVEETTCVEQESDVVQVTQNLNEDVHPVIADAVLERVPYVSAKSTK